MAEQFANPIPYERHGGRFIRWTKDLDVSIKCLRLNDGLPWEEIRARMGIAAVAIKKRALELGIPSERLLSNQSGADRQLFHRFRHIEITEGDVAND